MKKLLILFAWYLFVNSSKPYLEPIYYTVYENEKVIIKYSRKIYHNYNEIRYNTVLRVCNKFENESIDTINRNVQFLAYEEWENEGKFLTKAE